MDDIKELHKFMDTMRFKANHISNVYVIKSIKPDGTVTDVKYGMNLMTDFGFSQYYRNGADWPSTIYAGNGTQDFDKTTDDIISPVFNGAGTTLVSIHCETRLPMYYSPGEHDDDGIVTVMEKYMTCQFDAGLSTSDVVITEYGIGASSNYLWTHSFVYDTNGSRTVVIKRANEALQFTVYLCFSYEESLIMDGFSNNIYSIITASDIALEAGALHTPLNPGAGGYRNPKRDGTDGIRYYGIRATSTSAVVNSTITRTFILEDIRISPVVTAQTSFLEYMDGFLIEDYGFLVLQPQKLDPPISIETYPIWSFNINTEFGFAEQFGVEIPITQMDVSEVKRFNPFTGQWSSVGVYYFNDPTHDYCEASLSTALAVPMYYTNNHNLEILYVHVNTKPDDPIIKIRGNIETLYATDKYWKGLNIPNNDWIQITDRDNIPQAAQQKRFWITRTNDISLQPLRNSKDFYLKINQADADGGYTTTPFRFTALTLFSKPAVSIYNDQYHWSYVFGGDDIIIYNNQSELFAWDTNTVTNMATSSVVYATTYGKWLFVINKMNSTAQYAMWDTSDVPNGNLGTDIRASYNIGNANMFISETQTGFVIVSRNDSTGGAFIHDLRVDPVVTAQITCKCACAIPGVNKYAYITTDGTALKIYNLNTTQDEKSITIHFGVPISSCLR